MFSIRQKREIAEAVQKILRGTNHPELPAGEIEFELTVRGATSMSWAVIQNNERVTSPAINPHNESMDPMNAPTFKYWAYRHANGSVIVKRWFGDVKDYTTDCEGNPFVQEVIPPFSARDHEHAQELAEAAL